MYVTAQDVYQNAKELRESERFKEAEGEFQRAYELYYERGMYGPAIDCLIQKRMCIIEPYLQDVTILIIESEEARETLRDYLDEMETEIKEVTEELQNERILYNSLRKAYLQIERLYREYGFLAEAPEIFCRYMDYRRKLVWKMSKLRWLFLWILRLFIRYGERGWLLLVWVLGLILSFGALYWKFELIDFSKENASRPDFWDSLYFSVVTLTTLGFGDIHPTRLAGKIVAGLEATFGYAVVVIFISILVSRIIRRWY